MIFEFLKKKKLQHTFGTMIKFYSNSGKKTLIFWLKTQTKSKVDKEVEQNRRRIEEVDKVLVKNEQNIGKKLVKFW